MTSSSINDVVQAETPREPVTWRLPDLTARGVVVYRLCWALLFMVAVAVNLAAPHFNRQLRQTEHAPYSDLGLRQWNGRTMQVPHRPSLERAGIVAGSQIIAVAGRPVAEDATNVEVARMLAAEPSPVAMTIRSPDGVERNFRLPRNPRWIDLSYKGTGLTFRSRVVIDLVFAGLANLALIAVSALLFWRRPRDGLAALLSLTLLACAAFENLSWFTWQQLGLLNYTSYTFNAVFTLLLIGLLLSPDGRFVPRWSRWVALALIAATAVGSILTVFEAPPWLTIGMFIVAALFVVPAMRSRFRQTQIGSEGWQQQRWLLLGMSFSIAAMIATFALNNLSNSGLLNRQQLVWAYISSGVTLSLVPLFLALGMLVALLRYRLYDADAALSRSAGFAVVGLAFAALFAGFAKAIELGVERISGTSAGAVPGIAAAVLATILVTPAQSRIMGWADEKFRKALSHLRRDLPDCVDDLRETASLDELVAEILERVRTGLRVTSAAIEIDGRLTVRPEQSFSSEPYWPIRLPLRVQHRDDVQEGWLLVGRRPDGSLPARDEKEALEEIIDPISRSLRVVRAREARDRTLIKTFDELRRRIARIERRLPRAERT